MKAVSKVFQTDKPRYSGEFWRVVIVDGSSVTNHGFTTPEAAQAFYDEASKTHVSS